MKCIEQLGLKTVIFFFSIQRAVKSIFKSTFGSRNFKYQFINIYSVFMFIFVAKHYLLLINLEASKYFSIVFHKGEVIKISSTQNLLIVLKRKIKTFSSCR